MERLSITLPPDLAKLFNKKVKKGERSKFISKAIFDALNKKNKQKAFQSIQNFKPFMVAESSEQVLQKIRKPRASRSLHKGRKCD